MPSPTLRASINAEAWVANAVSRLTVVGNLVTDTTIATHAYTRGAAMRSLVTVENFLRSQSTRKHNASFLNQNVTAKLIKNFLTDTIRRNFHITNACFFRYGTDSIAPRRLSPHRALPQAPAMPVRTRAGSRRRPWLRQKRSKR